MSNRTRNGQARKPARWRTYALYAEAGLIGGLMILAVAMSFTGLVV